MNKRTRYEEELRLFINRNKPELVKQYALYRNNYKCVNGLDLRENFFNWVAYVKKDLDIINEFEKQFNPLGYIDEDGFLNLDDDFNRELNKIYLNNKYKGGLS